LGQAVPGCRFREFQKGFNLLRGPEESVLELQDLKALRQWALVRSNPLAILENQGEASG
jgi:hypothetical protein